ncbi:UNVERIFIED_CONTAM: hypothetical protein PYX00_010366 [Menopon gallinae]|uniref:Caprin-1 dimerization domain-containing protein n=1 Tax=Menopon gallinae TaxID=328185 RepID=A0AAW2HFN0_9NEOP
MPSASSKSEKPASSEAVDPLRQAIVVLEHRRRNLEKRKTKLDSYKESVKPLTRDQIEAVSKYDEVLQQLELTKEYVKQFNTISTENEKLKKKNAKKEAQERFLADAKKVRQVLIIQEVLQNMGDEAAKKDFLAGKNGAPMLTETDLKTLDDLYDLLNPEPAFGENTPSRDDQLQKTAELYLSIVEGKQKEVVGMTCLKLKELLTTIHNCGYFDKPLEEKPDPESHTKEHAADEQSESRTKENREEEAPEFREPEKILSNVIVPSQNPPEGALPQVQNPAPMQPLLQGAPMMPPGSQPPLMQPNPAQMIPPNVSNIVPTPVSQVESSYFNAQGVKPRAPQPVPPQTQTRQINEVIQSVTGKFSFLRESELEISEMGPTVVPPNSSGATPQIPAPVPAGIPTRTFTNQNFNGQPAGAPNFPAGYPPQPAAFQTYVPAFPAFVGPNNSPTPNNTLSSTNSSNNSINNINSTSNIPVNTTTAATSTTIDNMKNNNGNIHNSGNINNTTNKNNSNLSSSMNKNMPNPIPMSTSRNPNLACSQGQQQLNPGLTMQQNTQPGSQPPNQQTFQHVNVPQNPLVNAPIEETVHSESEKKDKKEMHRSDWNEQDNTNWADDWAESSEWKSGSHSEAGTSQNKFPSGRVNRNGTGGPRNANGYQGNRNRTNRQGGYRDQGNQGGGGNTNFYQNQNGYQPRSDRSNEYSGGKGNVDFRDNTFKDRGDFNNRDRDSYGGGFKRGPNNRGPNVKGPMDRGDRMGQECCCIT